MVALAKVIAITLPIGTGPSSCFLAISPDTRTSHLRVSMSLPHDKAGRKVVHFWMELFGVLSSVQCGLVYCRMWGAVKSAHTSFYWPSLAGMLRYRKYKMFLFILIQVINGREIINLTLR